MKKRAFLTILSVVIMSMTLIGQEQNKRFGFELSGGGSIPFGRLDDSKLQIGGGFEGTLHFRVTPSMGIYAGWGWNKMGSNTSFAGNDVCFEETGYVFGLQFKRKFNSSPLSYYVRGAGLYNHIEIENAGGAIIGDTKHGFGFQLAGGLDIPLGKNWSLTPGIKFNSLQRPLVYGGSNRTLSLNYMMVRVGILKTF
jgi:hypothetical protein